MCSDVARESYGLWFSTVEESRAELPHIRHRVGNCSLHPEDLAPLLIW